MFWGFFLFVEGRRGFFVLVVCVVFFLISWGVSCLFGLFNLCVFFRFFCCLFFSKKIEIKAQ